MTSRRVRVLIVDDSAVFRRLWTTILRPEIDIEVVGTAVDGQDAIQKCRDIRPDVVVMDVEMPVMDGLSAIPEVLKIDSKIRIVMASTLTTEGSLATVRGLTAGASDFIAKPSSVDPNRSIDHVAHEMIGKIRTLGRARIASGSAATSIDPLEQGSKTKAVLPSGNRRRPEVIAIGSSTGGPQALTDVLKRLSPSVQLPIVIAQHMPPHFTKMLASTLRNESQRPCEEATDGGDLQPGHVYIAPGDYHLRLQKVSGRITLSLSKDEAVHFCRPAVDPLFVSVAEVFGSAVLGVVLTGMGEDGRDGCAAIVRAGGHVIAQDEATSVVWGMPGAVVRAGLAEVISPLTLIPNWIESLSSGSGTGKAVAV